MLDSVLMVCYAGGTQHEGNALQPPQWVTDLADQICRDEGISERPRIEWKPAPAPRTFMGRWRADAQGTRRESSGRAFSRESSATREHDIRISAGYDAKDARLVFLHEMAHWLSPNTESHGNIFWNKAFDLYYRYGVEGRFAISRERQYRIKAREAYNRSLFVIRDGLEPEMVWKNLNKRCYCSCHKQLVKA